MTIDTNELRRLAQAATPPTTKGRWMRLFGERTVYDRMEDGCRGVTIVAVDHHPPGPQEAAYLDFIAAANPAAISELLDRIEATEKERDDVVQQLVQSEIGKREISEAHDALQVEVGKLKDLEVSRCVKINRYIVDNARLVEEVERLRAELSKQQALTDAAQHIAEVAQSRANQLQAKIIGMEQQEPVGTLHDDGCFVWRETAPHQSNYAGWKMALYALPGAQGEKK